MVDNVLNLKKEKEEMKNKNKLKLASDNTSDGGNWLANMPWNTFFVAEEKYSDNPIVQEFLKIPAQGNKVAVDLMVNPRTTGKDFTFIKVNPTRFVKKYDLVEVLDIEIETRGPENVPSNPSDSAGLEKPADGKEAGAGGSQDGEPVSPEGKQ